MLKSENIGQLAKALSLAQGQMQSAKKTSENPYFGSRYADLSQIIDVARKPLVDNGLAITQLIVPELDFAEIQTVLMHESGEWIASGIRLQPAKPNPQGMGSALTYARRYAYAAILGIASEDDDAECATGRDAKATDAKATSVSPYKATPEANEAEKYKSFWGALRKKGYTPEQVRSKLGVRSVKDDWVAKGKTLREAYDLIVAEGSDVATEPKVMSTWGEFWEAAKKITNKTEKEIPALLGLRTMEEWTGTLEEAIDELAKLCKRGDCSPA